jgi:RNA polymerase sigma-70 factor (ECF subfamily)
VLRTGVLRVIAWDELRGELHRFVARRVPAADAEDIVQEALLRIHRGLPGVRADGALVGWLYQVTRNAVVDHLRARRTVEETDDDSAAELEVDDAAFERLARCVRPFVGMLTTPYREALELVELGGISQVEAATRLGVPLPTMKSRVQRGRAQLRELLEQCCAIDVDARGHVLDVTPRKHTQSCSCSATDRLDCAGEHRGDRHRHEHAAAPDRR